MKKIFISIPITGRDPETVLLESTRAEELALDLKFRPVNPFRIIGGQINTDPNDQEHWRKSMEVCFKELLTCEQILIVDVPDRVNSKGCQIEEFVAKTMNLDLYYTDSTGKKIQKLPIHQKTS